MTFVDASAMVAAAAESREALAARLNLGRCFAYACARVREVPLLFVGDDFPRTDIRPALS